MKTFTYSAALATAIAVTAGMADAEVTLSVLIDNNPETVSSMEALTAAYTAANPDVTFDIEQRTGGADGDNIVKTRLATGEMADIFNYNSGSLFQALNPQETLADLTGIAGQANVLDSFKQVVTAPDGTVRGVPFGPAMGGGIFYNRALYAELGLSVPKSWDEFMANNAKVAEAGKVPVITTFGDTWTSQLFVLADFFNVQAEVPNFAADYTANKVKFATTPAAMRGFEYLEAVFKANYMNEDFGVATFEDGMRMVATGEGAHYPMLTFGIGTVKQNFPDNLADLGFFALPGPDAARNGLTVWMPAALYVPADSPNQEEAIRFLDFVASVEGCNTMIEASGASGPYLIKGCELPADVPPAVTDMLPYFQTEGMTAPALEFLSPIKGPALEQILVEVGSGIRPAAEAAALYDRDVEKQARQLGLPNW
ncbi:MAG: ABC transporter substrate-binding protein [Rhodobacter sp.]|nr:ABC transporter substrate-binding protein [Rhodobacter sp.]